MITKLDIERQIEHLQGDGVSREVRSLIDRCTEYELCDRRNFAGHITAGGIIIHLRSREVLLLEHKTLRRWLAPGGHVDWEDRSVCAAALREVLEETGLEEKMLIPLNMDRGKQYCVEIDSHPIPENPNREEFEHAHHDFRFLFGYAGDKLIDIDTRESLGYKWITLDDPYMREIVRSSEIDRMVIHGLERYEQTIREKHQNDYLKTPMAWYLFELARSYSARGETQLAEQAYRRCVEAFERTYDEEYETPPSIVPAMWNLALIYRQTGRHDQAQEVLEKAQEWAEMYARWDENFVDWVPLLKSAQVDKPVRIDPTRIA